MDDVEFDYFGEVEFIRNRRKGDKMQGTIEMVTKTKKGFKIQEDKDRWFNRGKALAGDFSTLQRGDVIDFDHMDGFVTRWSICEDGTTSTRPTSASGSVTVATPRTSDAISRGGAAKSVLTSPYIAELLKGDSNEETIQNMKDLIESVAKFSYGGTW